MPFIDVPIEVDADTLADDALQFLASQWENWDPSDGDLEVMQIEAIAPMAAEAATVAADVPDAIFRSYGTKLVGLPYLVAEPAYGLCTITAIDDAGYTSPDVIEFGIEGYGFATDAAVEVPAGQTEVADVPFTATEPGADANNLSGVTDLVSSLSWIADIMVPTGTQGGADEENDQQYQNRLSDRLLLQATTLVTPRDYELLALEVEGVGRAIAIGDQARKVTVVLTNEAGEPATQEVKDTVAALFDDYRQVNTIYEVKDAIYFTIDVAGTLVSLPDTDATALAADATASVVNWLSPATWGIPVNLQGAAGTENAWLNDQIVRYKELIRVLTVPGTRYIATAKDAKAGQPLAEADITLSSGPTDVTLTRPGAIDITAS